MQYHGMYCNAMQHSNMIEYPSSLRNAMIVVPFLRGWGVELPTPTSLQTVYVSNPISIPYPDILPMLIQECVDGHPHRLEVGSAICNFARVILWNICCVLQVCAL